MRNALPLSRRKIDIPILVFFWINVLFITYLFDLEQLLIRDPGDFAYPLWPPAVVIDLAHWWGTHFDPALMARPPWWMATIWIDFLFFGPFYVFAIYAYTKGREWIRIPSIIYASVMLTNVTIILSEEFFGEFASPDPVFVVLANGAWILFPILIIYRMWRYPHPFTIATTPGDPSDSGHS